MVVGAGVVAAVDAGAVVVSRGALVVGCEVVAAGTVIPEDSNRMLER